MLVFLLIAVFGLGTIIGSLLNVCIYRLPMEKSILWPGSHCGKCYQPIRWYDNVPLLSYLLLRGRCRTCGAKYSWRYFFIELLTGLLFAGLFYYVVADNIHQFEALQGERGRMAKGLFPTRTAWVVFGHHAALMSFLLVASFCDLDLREIPLSVTIPGALIGVLCAVLWAWPWPLTPAVAVRQMPLGQPWWPVPANLGPGQGLYPWPFWGPLPSLFVPGGNWQTGLATGLAGALVGSLLLRAVRFVFGIGMGVEALGLGDADLMMMAGGFMGWQPVVIGFFLGVFVGLVFGIVQLVLGGGHLMPFGPSLALAVMGSLLGWHWIAPRVQPLFFNGVLLLILVVGSGVLMLILSYILRLIKR